MGQYYAVNTTDYLMHHGVKGQKWGRRRYQNPDGTLTAEGKRHYGRMNDSINNMKTGKNAHKISAALTGASYGINTAMGAPAIARSAAIWKGVLATGNPAIIGAAAAATAIGVAGAYGINYATTRVAQHAIAGSMNKIHNKKLTQYRKEKFDVRQPYETIKSIKENPKKNTIRVKSVEKNSYDYGGKRVTEKRKHDRTYTKDGRIVKAITKRNKEALKADQEYDLYNYGEIPDKNKRRKLVYKNKNI